MAMKIYICLNRIYQCVHVCVICFIVYVTGADFSAVDSKGDTVVHLAVSNENAVWLELLLKAGGCSETVVKFT